MQFYPKHVINLPEVISFDEFKADTKEKNMPLYLMIQYIGRHLMEFQTEKRIPNTIFYKL